MTDTAILVENLSKRYRIGQKEEVSDTLVGAVRNLLTRPLTNLRKLRSLSTFRDSDDTSPDVIWALKDVSFEVKQGDVLGIIGRNGAGKSTLLKILSRITMPSRGEAIINGRVSSLLEVGTGFHPELTGRENIYLNGTILGMRKAEVDRKFDEIVDFSGIDKFLDTPVKRYSSGMQVRLAFAVAAHLEPEVLIIDEVLAVGDSEFQKKCLGKMQDVASVGRTVLFVSHNMAAVSGLCKQAMVLQHGQVCYPMGAAGDAIRYYLRQMNRLQQPQSAHNLSHRTDRRGDGKIRLLHFAMFDEAGQEQSEVLTGQDVELRVYYECRDNPNPKNVTLSIAIRTQMDVLITLVDNALTTGSFEAIGQRGFFSCVIPRLPLAPGIYMCNIAVRQQNIIQDWITEAAPINVEPGDFFQNGQLPPPSHTGVCFLEQIWSDTSL